MATDNYDARTSVVEDGVNRHVFSPARGLPGRLSTVTAWAWRTQDDGGYTCDRRAGRDITCHHRARTDHRPSPDGDAWEDDRACAKERALTDGDRAGQLGAGSELREVGQPIVMLDDCRRVDDCVLSDIAAGLHHSHGEHHGARPDAGVVRDLGTWMDDRCPGDPVGEFGNDLLPDARVADGDSTSGAVRDAVGPPDDGRTEDPDAV